VTLTATAFAPASVGNVGVGFDILGHTILGPGDRVTVRRASEPGVRIIEIRGSDVVLPMTAELNTAGAALIALSDAHALPCGFEVEIEKGIPFGSGMGGSAASAVAALVAANALLDRPFERRALYPFALDGEAVASGSRHGDNVGAMLLGGLVLSTKNRLVSIPVPAGLHCAMVHPHAVLETRAARKMLEGSYDLSTFVAQSAHLAQLLAGCYAGDFDLIRSGLDDVLIEPRRTALIPGFRAVKRAALHAGALGASISGAGPSVFAWCDSERAAQAIAQAMREAFASNGLDSDAWVSPVAGPATEVIACDT
jgi:homoserine kinase